MGQALCRHSRICSDSLVRRQQASGGEFRLGAGVVGHSTRVVIVAIVVIGALALILEKNTAVAINGIIAVAAVAAYYLKGTWQFADKHPDAAALAGTSWPKAEACQSSANNSATVEGRARANAR